MKLPQWVGKRNARRHTVIWAASLSDAAGSGRPCLVFNISEGGACLRIEDAARTTESLQLSIVGVGEFSARRAWARYNRVGIEFLSPAEDVRPMLDEALASPRSPL